MTSSLHSTPPPAARLGSTLALALILLANGCNCSDQSEEQKSLNREETPNTGSAPSQTSKRSSPEVAPAKVMHSFQEPGAGPLKSPESGFAHAMPAAQGFPPFEALGELTRIDVADMPSSADDNNLLTHALCAPSSQAGCVLPLRLPTKVNKGLVRIYMGGFTPKGQPLKAPEPLRVEIRKGSQKGELVSEHTIKDLKDFVHLSLPDEIEAGDYVLIWQFTEKTPANTVLPLSELALFGQREEESSPAPLDEWDPAAMVIRATTPFFSQLQSSYEKALSAWVDTVGSDFKFQRRFLGSRVLPIPGTPYALIERRLTAVCPGASHNYDLSYLILDRRSGLLVALQEAPLRSAHLMYFPQEKRIQIRETDGTGELRLALHLKKTTEGLKLSVQGPPLTYESGNEPWRPTTISIDDSCKEMTVLLQPKDRKLTDQHPGEEGQQEVISCPLPQGRQLLISEKQCMDGPGNYLLLKDAHAPLDLSGSPASRFLHKEYDEVRARRLPTGEWLVSTLNGDRGHLYRVDERGQFVHLSDHATFAITSAGHCRCSA